MSIKFPKLSPAQAIAVSLIGKDVVGCVMYTSMARSNKSYTPEKRSDVANYDLANGIINIGLQLLAVRPIESLMKKFSDSKIMKHFYKDLDLRLGSKDSKVVKSLLKHKEGLVKGSVAALSVVICQYVIKRFISPYFSMPTADKFKEIGLVKPKIYKGETYDKKKKDGDKSEAASEEPSFGAVENKKLDIMSGDDPETNLIKRYKKSQNV